MSGTHMQLLCNIVYMNYEYQRKLSHQEVGFLSFLLSSLAHLAVVSS